MGKHLSEDLVTQNARTLGRFRYLSLGSTTLAQLKRSRFIKGALTVEEERRKPDGIIFLPLGGIKAVVEAKTPKELTATKLPRVVKDYSPIARAVCKLLIVTDGTRVYWYNALTERPVLDENGTPIAFDFKLADLADGSLSRENVAKLISLIERADHSLTKDNDRFAPVVVIDPSALARTVWQKIWINTGKEPEKCLYNVVEILVFKFLSDIGVLVGNHSFTRIVQLLATDGDREALNQYGRVTRGKIRELFPKSVEDQTTIINGTIFVNEAGEPNLAQAGLFGEVIRAFQAFDDDNGSLKYIDRQFKTRLYETFLRQQAGIRSLGQYFTPRNVVQPIVRMSNAGQLKAGDALCDPFCGVGGFVLEAVAENPNLAKQFEPIDGKISPTIKIRGYDKGTDEKDDERTIILAKANMLVYLSDLLSVHHSTDELKQFAQAFNNVFRLIRTNLGTFGLVDADEKYDLILTNPPYVTSGSGSIKSAIEAADLTDDYTVGGRGTESLAIQWIVNHLKPNGQAFIIVPDGLLNQAPILQAIKDACEVLCVVALPSRTFYSTPKKTYILGLRRKDVEGAQTTPVLTYLVSEIGESRDTRRVSIPENDLSAMEREYLYFRAAPNDYTTPDARCKLVSWDQFDTARNWLVDRLWTEDEKVALGVVEEPFEVDADAFKGLVSDARAALEDLLKELS